MFSQKSKKKDYLWANFAGCKSQVQYQVTWGEGERNTWECLWNSAGFLAKYICDGAAHYFKLVNVGYQK